MLDFGKMDFKLGRVPWSLTMEQKFSAFGLMEDLQNMAK